MEESISLLDKLTPYQHLYDIISYRIETDLYKKQHQMATTNYVTYGTSNLNYSTPGQMDNTVFELNLKEEYFNPEKISLRKKLEENLPEECFIRDENGNLKKVIKAEAIEHELKSCVVENKYVNPLGNGIESQINRKEELYNRLTSETLNNFLTDTSRDYTPHTGSEGRDPFYQALSNYYFEGLNTSNHL